MSNTIENEKPSMKINVFDSTLKGWDEKSLGVLRFSKFVHKFSKDKIIALYHPLTHDIIYLEQKIFETYFGTLGKEIKAEKDLSPRQLDLINKLISSSFLVSKNYDEDRVIQNIRDIFSGNPSFSILHFVLTDDCNLRCKYCVGKPGGYRPTKMTKETIEKGLKFYAKVIKNNPLNRPIRRHQIIFYGGEPLLNWRVFLHGLSKIEEMKESGELPSNMNSSLITNGTIMNKRIIKELAHHKVVVSVSLDGFEEVHNANRVYRGKNERGTFQAAIKSIKQLKEAGITVGISCTVNSENLEVLDSIVEWVAEELKIRHLNLNLLADVPGVIQKEEEYSRKETDMIIKCYEIAREKGVYENRTARRIRAFVNKLLYLVDCGACGHQIVVNPDGHIGPCQIYMIGSEEPKNGEWKRLSPCQPKVGNEKIYAGSLDDEGFNPFENPTFIEWSKRSPFNMPECKFCECMGMCGGGCARISEVKTGDLWGLDTNFCIHVKSILEWLVWDLYKQADLEVII